MTRRRLALRLFEGLRSGGFTRRRPYAKPPYAFSKDDVAAALREAACRTGKG
jgi:hypothetical protein